MQQSIGKEALYSGLVWIVSGFALALYTLMGYMGVKVPGVEELVRFLSSVRVKIWASGAAALCTLILPLFVDIHAVSNEEGFFSVAVVAVISFVVGGLRLRIYFTMV